MKTTFLQKGKFIFKISLLLAILLTMINCKNDKNTDPAPPPAASQTTQDPLEGFLVQSGLIEKKVSLINNGFNESGFSFIPKTNGNIIALVLTLPAANEELRVTIWNKKTGKVLITEMVNFPKADVEVVKVIAPLVLVEGTEYLISMNTDDWYSFTRNDGKAISYPFSVGDITVTSYL